MTRSADRVVDIKTAVFPNRNGNNNGNNGNGSGR